MWNDPDVILPPAESSWETYVFVYAFVITGTKELTFNMLKEINDIISQSQSLPYCDWTYYLPYSKLNSIFTDSNNRGSADNMEYYLHL